MPRLLVPTALLPLLLGISACDATFDLDGKRACAGDSDCVAGYVCVAGDQRLGQCVRVTDLRVEDTGLSPDSAGGAEVPRSHEAGVCVDADGDGAFANPGCGTAVDCDDLDPNISPLEPERCNGVDDDCDGRVDEGFDLDRDPSHCGACGLRCAIAGGARCVGGRCVDSACGTPTSDCAEAPTLAGRTYFAVLWDASSSVPSLHTARLTFDARGSAAHVEDHERTNVTVSGRSERVPPSTWTVREVSSEGIVLSAGAADVFALRGGGATGALAGHSPSGMLLLMLETALDEAPAVAGDWLAWRLSPLNELRPVPGGIEALDWIEPVELAWLRLGRVGAGGRGGVTWPFVERRDEHVGDVASSSSIRPVGYRLDPDGSFAVQHLDFGPSSVEEEFDGAVTRSGAFALGVRRQSSTRCGTRRSTNGRCAHDPVLSAMVRRGAPIGLDHMVGEWRIVGFSYRADGPQLPHRWLDIGITVDNAAAITGDVSGSTGVFGSSDSPVAPMVRLDLRGDAVGGGTLTLEGLTTDDGLGLFWDQSVTLRARPLTGSLYLAFRP